MTPCEIFFFSEEFQACGEAPEVGLLDDIIFRRFSEFELGAAGAKVLSSTGHWIGRQKADAKVTTMN